MPRIDENALALSTVTGAYAVALMLTEAQRVRLLDHLSQDGPHAQIALTQLWDRFGVSLSHNELSDSPESEILFNLPCLPEPVGLATFATVIVCPQDMLRHPVSSFRAQIALGITKQLPVIHLSVTPQVIPRPLFWWGTRGLEIAQHFNPEARVVNWTMRAIDGGLLFDCGCRANSYCNFHSLLERWKDGVMHQRIAHRTIAQLWQKLIYYLTAPYELGNTHLSWEWYEAMLHLLEFPPPQAWWSDTIDSEWFRLRRNSPFWLRSIDIPRLTSFLEQERRRLARD
jgi:hypothetical protein